jgi:hypothetical protein
VAISILFFERSLAQKGRMFCFFLKNLNPPFPTPYTQFSISLFGDAKEPLGVFQILELSLH